MDNIDGQTETQDRRAGEGGADGALAADAVLELNFVPRWARTPPAGGVYQEGSGSGAGRRPESGGRDRYPPRDGAARNRAPRPAHPRGDERRPPERGRVRERELPVEPAPVSVRFLPEQHGLASIVRRISHTRRAYPLTEIAYIFLSNPEACSVKIEIERADGRPAAMYQCEICRSVAMGEAAIKGHVVSRHLADFFAVEERVSEPPSGQFVCIARCGLSGALLGPPNHHSYAARVQDVYQSGFSGMPFDEYQRRIAMVHDPALIEQWKTESCRQRVYTLKSPHPDWKEPAGRAAAEAFMRRHIVPGLVRTAQRAVVPLAVARTFEDAALLASLREALAREDRFPLSLMMALRAAFRHLRLHVFKAGQGRGVNFVTSTPPFPLAAARVVKPIEELLADLHVHPGCTRAELLARLHPGEPDNSEANREVLSHLNWLIDKGHVIEFFNGTLAVPLARSEAVGSA